MTRKYGSKIKHMFRPSHRDDFKRPFIDSRFRPFVTSLRISPPHSSDRSRSARAFSIAAKILPIEHPRYGIPHTRHSSHSPVPCRPFHVVCYRARADCSFHVTAEMIESPERGGRGEGAIEDPEDSTWHFVSRASRAIWQACFYAALRVEVGK